MDPVRIEGEVDDLRPAVAEPTAVAGPGAGPVFGRPTSSAGVLALQRLVGNAAVASMLQGQNPADLLPEPDTQRAAPPPESTTEEGAGDAQPPPEGQAAEPAGQAPAGQPAAEPAAQQAGTAGALAGQLSWLPPELAAAIAAQAEEADTQQAAVEGGARVAAADASVQAAAGAAAGQGAPAAGPAAGAPGAAAEGAAKAAGTAAEGAERAAPGGAAKEGAAAGDGAGAAGAAAAAPPAAAVSAEPAPRVDPKDDAKFTSMESRTKAAGTKTKTHQPAAAGAATAQGAAVPPGNDLASQAQAAQVEVMGAQEPGAFDRAAFIAAVKKSIEAATPKNLKEVTNFKESGKAAKVKGEVGGLIKGGKQASEKDMKGATVAPPDPSKATPKTVVPMENDEHGTAPKAVGAAAAMPQPRPEEDTDLSAGPAEVEKTMEESQLTEEQIQKSNEPEFMEALDAKQEAKQHAETGPEEFRQQEDETLGQAREGAEGAEAAKLAGMHGARGQALAKVLGHKGEAKTQDETKRAKVAADIQAIYERTKTDVTKTLEAIDPKVDAIFTKGEEGARTEFEDDVSARMSAYKKKRYSGWRGKLRWAKDKLFGMPDAVNAFYEEGKRAYLQRMEGVIGQVADVVGEGLTTARQRIAEGRAEVRKYVAQLPNDLKQVGKDAEEKLDAQFEELEGDIDAKQGELVDSLAQKYLEARDTLDKRIEELKEANKGLVQKAIDKVVGVAKAIWRLKDLLLNVLIKAISVIGDIVSDPIGFVGNLASAFMGGFNRFMGNIARHLQEGLTRWLFGTLGEAGIQMPKTLDIGGVFELVMQLLGLTYQNIRERVAKQVGPENVAMLEEKVDVFQAMVGKGLAGLWDFVKEKIGNFEDIVLGALKDFVIERVIKAGVPTLLAMLNPATAFIRACIAIYDFVMWLIDKGNEIMELINSLLDSISAIARGSIGEAVDYIENTLAKALPLAISLLASVMRLGGLPEKIKSVIETVRKPVRKAVDTVILGAVKGAKSLLGRPAAYVRGKVEAGKQWARGKVEAGKEWAAGKIDAATAKVTGQGAEAQHGPEAARPGVDPRTDDEKQASLVAATSEVEDIADDPGAEREKVEQQLPVIRERHRLKELKLIEEEGETKVQATINPTRTVPVEIPPETAAALDAKLKSLRMQGAIKHLQHSDVAKIIKALTKVTEGDALIAHILSGRFDRFWGYGQVLSNCKKADECGSVLQCLDKAALLLSIMPDLELRFEDTDKAPPPAGYDVDLAVMRPKGGFGTVFQFGQVQGSRNITDKGVKGAEQLAGVAALKKIVDIEVLAATTPKMRDGQMVLDDGSSTYFDAWNYEQGVRIWKAANPDVELHVKFSDGVFRKF